MTEPEIPIVSSTIIEGESQPRLITSVEDLKAELAGSVFRQVRLDDIVKFIQALGIRRVVDISPEETLTKLFSRIQNNLELMSLEKRLKELGLFTSSQTSFSSAI